MQGQAVDFEIKGIDNKDVATWISKNLVFDQLILEFYTPGQPSSGWVHCSYVAGRNRKQKKITRTIISTGKDKKKTTTFPIVADF